MQDRIFKSKDKDGNEIILAFKRPNQTVLSKAELIFRSAFSKAFRENILTNAEVEKYLRERGIWDSSKDQEAFEMRKKIAEMEKRLEDPSLTNEQGMELCGEISRVRVSLMILNNIHSSISDNTCETIATEAQNHLLCAECIVDNKTGLKLYKDVEDFKSRLEQPYTTDAFRETVIAALEVRVGRNLPSDLASEYAENKWKRARGVLKEEKELVQEATESKDEEAPKKKKKT